MNDMQVHMHLSLSNVMLTINPSEQLCKAEVLNSKWVVSI